MPERIASDAQGGRRIVPKKSGGRALSLIPTFSRQREKEPIQRIYGLAINCSGLSPLPRAGEG
ncbi:hypothetical protein SAMN06273570_1238 [Candidatus Pantoea floridensis]|uniref:Uncharacterized protein n=1 Tax=Candidatus Pantoea floridensis TaxID=1938870 RepID=A0A286BRY4_9GAMM|nr:hypothetical protein BX596_2915 [Enterobacteriaceae bacterium JKS000233]SOD36919.1 hypothetical protein SAMN06273570_1238 [Pantoea floridensis]